MLENKYNLILELCLLNLTLSISNISFILSSNICDTLEFYTFEYYSFLLDEVIKLNVQSTLIILFNIVIAYGIYKIIETLLN